MKEYISIGILAKKLNVSPRTVSKWFDDGELTGFRIPGGKHRRVLLTSAMTFAEKHGLPTDKLKEYK